MINRKVFINLAAVIFLIFLQIFIFNNINFEGSINPYPYIIFILLYPPHRNKYVFLALCFILGLGVDIFENTGGINAFASVFIGFFKNKLIRLLSGKTNFEIDEFKFYEFNIVQWIFYLGVLIFAHHVLVFLLENFSLNHLTSVLLKALRSSIFTFALIVFYVILFRKKDRE